MTNAKNLWVCVVVSPLLFYLCQTMCVWEWPRALGELAFSLMTLSVVLVLPILASPFVVIYYVVDAFLHRKEVRHRNQSLSSAGAWVSFVVLSGVAIVHGNQTRLANFARATHPGTLIIQALTNFQKDHGQYPDELAELVPKYLNSIPYTGLIAYPEFRYTKARNDLEVRQGQYELRINCSSGGINFDRFIYWPSETYPDRIQSDRVSRIGAWAYLHE